MKARTIGGSKAFATFIRGYRMWHIYLYCLG